jgi:hypothetical protein
MRAAVTQAAINREWATRCARSSRASIVPTSSNGAASSRDGTASPCRGGEGGKLRMGHVSLDWRGASFRFACQRRSGKVRCASAHGSSPLAPWLQSDRQELNIRSRPVKHVVKFFGGFSCVWRHHDAARAWFCPVPSWRAPRLGARLAMKGQASSRAQIDVRYRDAKRVK